MTGFGDLSSVTADLARTAAKYDESGDFPADGIRAVHDAGLLTATISGGATVTDLTRILLALGRGDPSVALIASMTLLPHLAEAYRPTWPADLYADVVAASRERPTLINVCRVEPELGSPARGGLPATVARRTDTGWSLTGHKRFVTGAAGLSYFLVWARTEEDPPRVGTFVASAEEPGIAVVPAWEQLGLVATTDRFKAAAGEIKVLLTGAERLLFDTAGRFDAGEEVPGTEALGVRLLASRQSVAAVTLAVRLLGNPGLSRGLPLERHFRDVQSALVHHPQEDVVLHLIGSAALAA